MSFSNSIRRRLVRRVALGLAVAAVAAPSAAATALPAIEVSQDGYLNVKDAPAAFELPAMEVAPVGT